MSGTTPTQSLRYATVDDVITHATLMNLADDIAVQLDAADALRTTALKRPEAWARRSATFSVADGATVTVTFDVEDEDTHSMIDLVAQPTRITCGATAGIGIYYVTARCTNIGGAVSNQQSIFIMKNGSLEIGNSEFGISVGPLYVAGLVAMTATTDFLTCTLYHSGGGTVSMSSVTLRAHKVASL